MPVRIRRKARLRCTHGARLTRAGQGEREDASFRYALGEQSALGEEALSMDRGSYLALAGRLSPLPGQRLQPDPGRAVVYVSLPRYVRSYFNFLSDDDDGDNSSSTRSEYLDDFFYHHQPFQIDDHLGRLEGLRLLPYRKIVNRLAGPSFLDYLGLALPSLSYNQKESEEYMAIQNADLGELAGTTVQAVQDSEESSPTPNDDDRNTIALEQKMRQLDIGEEISEEELLDFMAQLPPTYYIDSYQKLHWDQQKLLYEGHALYRIRACKLLEGKYPHQLQYADLKRRYTPEYLAEKGYFMRYDKDGTFCWFFHLGHCELACLDDYQRLVLLNDGGYKYIDWDDYCSSYHTVEIDREYVKYCETFSKQVEWIEEYLDLYTTCREKWWKMRDRAFRQAMKIATSFTKISVLVRLAFREYTSSVTFDFYNLKDLNCVYFEIWKRVTKQQKSFQVALKEVYQHNKFPLYQGRLKYALEIDCSSCEEEFRSFTAGITGEVAEDKALESIAKIIKKTCMKPKRYEQYARKKLKIAELLGLITKA